MPESRHHPIDQDAVSDHRAAWRHGRPRIGATRVASVILAGILLLAAIAKLATLNAKSHSTSTDLFSSYTRNSIGIAILVIGFELLLGLWLLSGWRPRVALYVSAMTFALFLGIILRELRNPVVRPCGCFGARAMQAADSQTTIRWKLVATGFVDLFCLVLAISGVHLGRQSVAFERQAAPFTAK